MNRAAVHDPKAQPDVCPKCGGKLHFERAPGGSGQTVETCENLLLSTAKPGVNIGTCDHWRMLEVMRQPAHLPAPAPAPREPQPAHSLRLRQTPRSHGIRGTTARKLDRVLAALPDRPVGARTKDEIARALGMPVENAYRYLEMLVAQGRAAMQFRRHGQPARPPKEYWATRAGKEAA